MEKTYFVAMPDNEQAFFNYINLVINNKNNTHPVNERPTRIGPVKNLNYTRNECNELYIEVQHLKEKIFIEMLIDQFCLLRTYWKDIDASIEYKEQDIYNV